MKRMALIATFALALLCAGHLKAQDAPTEDPPKTKAVPPPMEWYFPSKVLFFMKARDASALPDYFKKSPLYRIWQEKDVQTLLKEPLNEMMEQFEETLKEFEKESGVEAKDILDMIKGEVTVALLDMDIPVPRQPPGPGMPGPAMRPPARPEFKLVVSVDIGDKKEEFSKILETVQNAMLKEYGEGGPVPSTSEFKGHKIYSLGDADLQLNATWLGTRWVLSLDKDTLQGIIKRYLSRGVSADSLEANKVFSTIYEKCGKGRETLFLYSDMSGLTDKLKGSLPPDAGKMLADMGLFDSMASGYGTVLEPDGTCRELSYAIVPEGHRLFELFGKSKADMALHLPPDNIILWFSAGYDLTANFNYVMNLLSTSMREQGKDVADALKKLEETLGFKIEEELLKSFETTLSFYLMLPEGGGAFPEIALVVGVAKPELLKAAIEKFARNMGEDLKTTEYLGHKLYYFSVDKLAGEKAELPYWPAFALAGGKLRIASSPQVLKRMIISAEKPVEPTGNLKTALAGTPKDAHQFVYVDAKKAFSYLYNTLLPYMNKEMKESVPEFLDPAKLPPVEVFTKHLSYIYSFSAKDDSGVYSQVVSPAGPVALTMMGAVIGAAAAMPGMLRPGPRGLGPAVPGPGGTAPAGQARIAAALRTISSAQEQHKLDSGAYAKNLQVLADKGLISRELGTGIYGGYILEIEAEGAGKWNIMARPLVPADDKSYFYADQSGVIRTSKTPDVGPESLPYPGK